MIIWNTRAKRSKDVINAVTNELLKDNINIDGVVDIFNDGKEEGFVLKIFDKYNPNIDLCFWVYMPSNREIDNVIEVITGRHINCSKNNMWLNDENLKSMRFENKVAIEEI